VLEHHTNRTFPNFRGISRRLFHASILSRNGASGKAGAVHVGSSREMVSRILKDLRAGEYIALKGKRIVIQKHIPDRW